MNDGDVLLLNGGRLEFLLQRPARFERLGDQQHSAGFAVQPVKKGRGDSRLVLIVPAKLADEAGILALLGWMAHQARGLVHGRKLDILKNRAKLGMFDG